MKKLSVGLALFVALEHVGFMILEMVFWTKPLGLATFKRTQEQADSSASLAMNQGLYNGFLAAGLVWSVLLRDPAIANPVRIFFLACVVVAGLFGGATASPTIFAVQALPGVIALLVAVAARRPVSSESPS